MMQLFKTFNSLEARDISFEQLADIIGHDEELKNSTQLYRNLKAQGHDKAAKNVKEGTPQVAPSFRMEGGKGKDNCRECLYMVLIDFDAKEPGKRLAADELERVKTFMRTSYHALLGYESISGLGYHILVPFSLPEGIDIDMQADPKQAEEIYTRAYRHIANLYSVHCEHPMDMECKNVNRMSGLAHDPLVVYRPDARPIHLTRAELGIDADGKLVKQKKVKRTANKDGKAVGVPLGNRLQQAVKMLEQADAGFVPGNRHNFVMRVAFILNRMGVNEDEAAQALDDAYLGHMDDKPSGILHSCYKTASDEFGAWVQQNTQLKTEIIADFLKRQNLQYDILTQKIRQLQPDGTWLELKERQENDLYIACCAESDTNLTEKLFHTVLNSSVVPEVNPLREYVTTRAPWTPDMPDYILQTAQMVHMATPEEQQLWQMCFPRWFVAMVAGWVYDDIVNHQVIVLIGRQGIYKTNWINRLLPPELKSYSTDNIDVDRLDKDELLRAAEYGLINIDELDRFTDKQLNRVKQMITTSSIDVRAPFGRHKEKRVRVGSYAASGNKQEFLTDQTGNRRWLPFHVEAIQSPFTHRMPYDGMYAQALYLLQNGYNYWFETSETDAIEPHVDEFRVTQTEEELIPIYFSPAKMEDPGSIFYTLGEIAAKITAHGNLKRNIDNSKLGAIMTRLGFEKKRMGHGNITHYYVREHTQSEIDQIHHPEIF